LSGLSALAIDDRGRGARLSAFGFARRHVECVVDALQRTVPVPQHEVVMRCALRRQVLRQGLPLAAGREHVKDRVQNLANVHLAPPTAMLGRRDRRLDQRPLGVRQIAGITQAAALRGKTMFRLPHRAPLGKDPGARQ